MHVALGKSTIRDGKHVHEFNMKDVGDGFNTSHVIHKVDERVLFLSGLCNLVQCVEVHIGFEQVESN